MSGSNLKVSNPYPRPRGATFPWSRDRRLWLSSQTLFFEQRVREDLWLSATCAVVGNGEQLVCGGRTHCSKNENFSDCCRLSTAYPQEPV